MESEHSLANVAVEISWIQMLLKLLHLHLSMAPIIWCSNASAVSFGLELGVSCCWLLKLEIWEKLGVRFSLGTEVQYIINCTR